MNKEMKCCAGTGTFGNCGRGTKKLIDGTDCIGVHCRCMQKDCFNMHYVDCYKHYIHIEKVDPEFQPTSDSAPLYSPPHTPSMHPSMYEDYDAKKIYAIFDNEDDSIFQCHGVGLYFKSRDDAELFFEGEVLDHDYFSIRLR